MSSKLVLKLDVLLVPGLLSVVDLSANSCAVIDILRATTTITTALAAGAKEVIPCQNAIEARQRTSALEDKTYLLGGEEKSVKIPGFDLGNSPLEYKPEIVRGKTIFFCTTNGTPTLKTAYAKSQLPVYIAALLNLSGVASEIVKQVEGKAPAKAVLICSGSYGNLAQEDVYCAGLMVKKIEVLAGERNITLDLYDGAQVAQAFAASNESNALEVLTTSKHGCSLEDIGFASDLAFAAQIDRYAIAPLFNGESITLQSG
ncbi:MAG: 2-phosphosulfolactate phosphatase [Chloroflexota bacterium]